MAKIEWDKAKSWRGSYRGFGILLEHTAANSWCWRAWNRAETSEVDPGHNWPTRKVAEESAMLALDACVGE